jgi:hypothetical protein
MSAPEQFKTTVTSASDPSGWRGGLERRRARRSRGGHLNGQSRRATDFRSVATLE